MEKSKEKATEWPAVVDFDGDKYIVDFEARAFISDKKHTARPGLDDVIWQIRRRYEVYQRNTYEIELAKCAAINCLFKHEA